MNENTILKMTNIEKDYYGNKVLKGINISVEKGQVLAVVGENGAGKSTLMNILFGMPCIHDTGGFNGEIFIKGKKVDIKSPVKAMELGIGMVHQEFMLMPGFTITENVKLNREVTRPNFLSHMLGSKLESLDMPKMRQDTKKALDTLGVSIDEQLSVAGLPVGYKQFVEIARELDKSEINLIVFDEPTATLTEMEADILLKAMHKLAVSGISIIFISHRLEEVMEISDKITILRDGELVETLDKKDASIEKIAQLMVGRSVDRIVSKKEDIQKSDVVMRIRDLEVNMPGEEVDGIDLDIYRGEILGIGGLAGHGKLGIANGIMGLFEARGRMEKDGRPLKLNNPSNVLKNGLAFVSEDRRGVGLLLDDSIELNIAVAAMNIQDKFLEGKLKLFSKRHIRKHALSMIEELDIRCTSPAQPVKRLSGGNQQKVCIAKALTLEPDVLFVSEPTRGIDVGAKSIVLDLLVKLNREYGTTIVITSSELGELRSICDRIAIVYKGKLEGVLSPDDSDVNFGLMMVGQYGKEEK